MSENLRERGSYVIANYERSRVGQETMGHISPIAACTEQAERFLVLDVARYRPPPVWVPAADAYRAMNTPARVSGQTRGLVLVEAAPGAAGRVGLSVVNRVVRMLAVVGAAVFALGQGVVVRTHDDGGMRLWHGFDGRGALVALAMAFPRTALPAAQAERLR